MHQYNIVDDITSYKYMISFLLLPKDSDMPLPIYVTWSTTTSDYLSRSCDDLAGP